MKPLLEMYNNSPVRFEDSQFVDGDGNAWTAPYLYKKAKELGLKKERVSLRHLDLSAIPWQDGVIRSMDCFLYHANRIKRADLSYPIIMRDDGYIIDGWHRVAKAILNGGSSILAYRFETYIEPDKPAK